MMLPARRLLAPRPPRSEYPFWLVTFLSGAIAAVTLLALLGLYALTRAWQYLPLAGLVALILAAHIAAWWLARFARARRYDLGIWLIAVSQILSAALAPLFMTEYWIIGLFLLVLVPIEVGVAHRRSVQRVPLVAVLSLIGAAGMIVVDLIGPPERLTILVDPSTPLRAGPSIGSGQVLPSAPFLVVAFLALHLVGLAVLLWRLRLRPQSPYYTRLDLATQHTFVFFGIAAVSIVLVTGALAFQIRSSQIAQVGQRFTTLAETNAERVGNSLARRIDALAAFGRQNSVLLEGLAEAGASYPQSEAEVQALLKERERLWQTSPDESDFVRGIRRNPQAIELLRFQRDDLAHRDVFLTDRHGALVAAQGARPAQFYFGEEAWWHAAWNDGWGGTYVGDLQIDPCASRLQTTTCGAASLFVATGVLNPRTNRMEGVLASTLQLRSIQRDIETADANSGAEVRLIAPDGRAIASPDAQEIGQILKLQTPNLKIQRRGWLMGTDSRDNPAVLGYAPINTQRLSASAIGWKVVVSDTQAHALSEVTRSAKVAALAALLALALAVLAAIASARVLTRPIEALTKTASAIQAGKLDQRVEPVGPVEMILLADTFNELTTRQRELISSLQDQVTQHTAQLQKRIEELAALNRITQSVAGVHDLNTALEIVAQELVHLFKVRNSGIALLNPARTALTIVAEYSERAEHRGTIGIVIPVIDNPSSARVIETGRPVVVAEAQTNPLTEPIHDLMQRRGTQALMIVPLLARGEVIGTIGMATDQTGREFTSAEVSLAETIAGQIAGAIDNARLFETERTAREQAETLRAATQALSTTLDLQQVFDVLLTELQKVVPYDSSSVLQVKGDRLVIIGGRGFPNPDEILGLSFGLTDESSPSTEVARRRAPYILEDAPNLYRGFRAEPHAEAGIRSWMGVPLLFGDRLIGMFTLDKRQPGFYTEAHARLALAFAAQAAVAIENARLFEETQQGIAELAIINSIGQALASQLELNALIELVGEKLRLIFDVQYVFIALLDRQTPADSARGQAGIISFPYYWDLDHREASEETFRLGEGLTSRIIESRQPQLINFDWERRAIELGAIFTGEPVKCSLGVPILVGDEAIGAIMLQSTQREGVFTDSDVRLLTTIAANVGVAIQNARLFQETTRLLEQSQQRAAELAVINSVQQALASQLDFQAAIEMEGDKIREVFKAQGLYIALVDQASGTIHFPYWLEQGQRFQVPARPLGAGFTSHVIRTRRPFVINRDIEKRRAELGASSSQSGPPIKAYAGVPLLAGEDVIGVIALGNWDHEDAFSDSDVRLLTTLASSMSVALQNARLFGETKRLLEQSRQRAAELATINSIVQALASQPELHALIDLVGEQMRQIFDAQIVYIALLDRRTDLIHFPYYHEIDRRIAARPLRLGEGWASKIIQSRQPMLINRDLAQRRAALGIEIIGSPSKTYLGVPITVGDESIGVISVQNTEREEVFSEADVRLLTTIAANVGAAIERARLYASAQEQKQYFESIVLYNPVAIVTMDPNATVLSWNPAAERLFGYTASEAIGCNIDDLIATSQAIHAEAIAYSRQAMSGERLHVITRRNRKDGTLVDVEVLAVPVEVGGQPQAYVAIYHDITDLQRARREAETANQAKSAFLANVSHELRTPLTSVLGFAKIIKKRLDEVIFPKVRDDDSRTRRAVAQVRDNIDIIVSEGERLTALINDVLDLAKIEAGRVEWQAQPVRIADVIERAATATASLFAAKRLAQITDIDPDLPEIVGDHDRLVQVMINLISNAVKFTERGSVTCRARLSPALAPSARESQRSGGGRSPTTPLGGAQAAAGGPGGQDIVVSVIDTGVGIARDDLSKVFEQFVQVGDTLTDKPQGTGLGLAISKQIVEHHGGRIWVESVVGAGSTFSFTLPVDGAASGDSQSSVISNRYSERLAETVPSDRTVRSNE
ncbi:MAG TPA: GAF domain-containing protein [Anaerolineae bacterium]|nr:GAF domain-containing protein [Anaerolineae bacterium]